MYKRPVLIGRIIRRLTIPRMDARTEYTSSNTSMLEATIGKQKPCPHTANVLINREGDKCLKPILATHDQIIVHQHDEVGLRSSPQCIHLSSIVEWFAGWPACYDPLETKPPIMI